MIKPSIVKGSRVRRNVKINETIKGVNNGQVTDAVETRLTGSTSGEDSSRLTVDLKYEDVDHVRGLGAAVVGDPGNYRLQIQNGSDADGLAVQELPLPGVEELDSSYKEVASSLGVRKVSVRGSGQGDKLERLEIQLGEFGSYLLSDGEMRLFQRGQFQPVQGVTSVDSDILGTIRGRAGKYGSSFHDSLNSEVMTELRNSILGGEEQDNAERAELLGEGWHHEYGNENEVLFQIRMQSGDRQRLEFNLKNESVTFITSQAIPGQFHQGEIKVVYKVASDGQVTRHRETNHG